MTDLPPRIYTKFDKAISGHLRCSSKDEYSEMSVVRKKFLILAKNLQGLTLYCAHIKEVHNMLRGAKYGRYSCDRQNEQSIDGQFRVIDDYAAKNGIEIVATYIDKAMTGTNDNREGFQQMMKDSDKKEWDVVLVYKLDRFSRNKYEMAIHRKHLKDNGIKIISVMENIPDSPEGILLESLLEGMNQYYSEELSQKTKRGMNETRLKGNFIGGIINYGWSLYPVYSEENGKKVQTATKVAINKEEASIVKEIFTEYANGKNPIDIARELSKRGVLNRGKYFRADTIYHILRQEKYTGIYRINGCAYDKIYPPIVPIEVYNIAKARIDANKYGSHPRTEHPYLLKGKIFCGHCGRRMTSFAGTSKSGKVSRYYKCPKSEPCPQQRTVKKEVLEQAITKAFEKMLATEGNFNLLVNKILETFNSNLYDTSALRLAEKELQRVESSLINLITAVENGFFSESTNARLKELENRKTELKEIIASERGKEVKPLSQKQVVDYLSYAITQPAQNLIDLLVRKVLIKDDIVDVYLKYKNDDSPDDSPKRGRPKRNSKNPERNLSEQGFLFMSYTFSYETSPKGRKCKFSNPKQGEIKSIVIEVLV